MNTPPLLLGAALAFWGWRSGNYAAAAALALLAEAPRVVRARFEFRPADLARVADLCAAFFVGLLVWLFASLDEPRTARAVLTSFLWLPAVLMPVLLVQRFSSTGRIPLSALFRYLRKARERDPSIPDPAVDLSGVYLAACLLAAGIPNQRDHVFYAGIVLLVAWALAPLRPRHSSFAAWLGVIIVAAGLGYSAQLGLTRLQAALDDWVSDWFLSGIAPDPYRSTTDLGSVGRLKLVDAIVLRVYASAEEAPRFKLLHRVSFNSLQGTTWIARQAPMAPLEPQADGTTWQLSPGVPTGSARIVARLEGGKALLALPSGTLRVSELPAIALRRNFLGATLIDIGGGDWSPYVAESAASIEGYAAPRADDLAIPQAEREPFARLAAELGLETLPADKVLERVREHFAGFAYSTYREAPVPAGTSALADFLRRSKSGHCEYFAAATTLLLRAAGIPARYATGFSMQEYSRLEGAYVVRARHAHAWTRAYVDGRWLDLDTTPPSWFEAEESLAPAWQGVADFLRWAGFRWSQRGTLEGGVGWYAAVALLTVLLAWRLARAKRAMPATSANARRNFAGTDSEFYAVERALARRGLPRAPQDSLAAWSRHAAATLGAENRARFERALGLHRRYRFDPQGLGAAERERLRGECLTLSRALD